MKIKFKNNTKVFIVLAFVFVVVSSIYFSFYKLPTSDMELININQENVTEIIEYNSQNSSWQNYSNEELGIAFQYPNDWFLLVKEDIDETKFGAKFDTKLNLIVATEDTDNLSDIASSFVMRVEDLPYEQSYNLQANFYNNFFDLKRDVTLSGKNGISIELGRKLANKPKARPYLVNKFYLFPLNNGVETLYIVLTPEQNSVSENYSESALKKMLVLENILKTVVIE